MTNGSGTTAGTDEICRIAASTETKRLLQLKHMAHSETSIGICFFATPTVPEEQKERGTYQCAARWEMAGGGCEPRNSIGMRRWVRPATYHRDISSGHIRRVIEPLTRDVHFCGTTVVPIKCLNGRPFCRCLLKKSRVFFPTSNTSVQRGYEHNNLPAARLVGSVVS